MISPQLKNSVLEVLCKNCIPESTVEFIIDDLNIDISFDDLNAVLKQFQRLGLISDLNCRPIKIYLCLNLEAIDFHRLGGFSIQELMTKQTLQKLRLEVEQLQEEFPEKTQLFTSILANIATVLTFFIKK